MSYPTTSTPGVSKLVTGFGVSVSGGVNRYGNLLTLVAFIAVFAGAFTFAGVTIAVRILITAMCWMLVAFPGDDTPDKPVLDSDPRVCVLGHAADLLIVFSIAFSLIQGTSLDGPHVAAGISVWAASLFMILGTVFRLASQAPRLHVERMMRSGSICLSLFLLSLSWELASIVVLIGPIGFALIELSEGFKALGKSNTDPVEVIKAKTSKGQDQPPSLVGSEINAN